MRYSVIVPVYNSMPYLKDCIDSVLKNNIVPEIIIIDDGSSDGSEKLCDTLSETYSQIQVQHIENSGAGNARNVGLKISTGDYVLFLDSDDMISEGFFDRLSRIQDNECDIIFFETIKLFNNGSTQPMNEGFVPEKLSGNKEQVLKHIASFNKFPASCSGKIIKRRFLIDNNIAFPTGSMGEDIDWTLNILLCAGKFGYFDSGCYIYRQIENSRSGKGSIDTISDLVSMLEKWAKIAKTHPYGKYIYSYLAYEYAMIFPFLGAVNRSYRKMFKTKMKKYEYLLNFGKTRKLKIIKRCLKIAGINNTAKILYAYIMLRDGI